MWWLANVSLLALWCTSAQLGFLGNSFFCHSWSWHLTTAAVLFHFSRRLCAARGGQLFLTKGMFPSGKARCERRILSGNRLFYDAGLQKYLIPLLFFYCLCVPAGLYTVLPWEHLRINPSCAYSAFLKEQ